MLKLRVLELLEKSGKTKYWLYMQLGMSYQNFSRMVNKQSPFATKILKPSAKFLTAPQTTFSKPPRSKK